MPSQTIYLPDQAMQYVRDVKEKNGLENVSQAMQKIVFEHGENDE